MIGPFYFIRMTGVPESLRQTCELIQRTGVDGSAVLRTGYRGRPFTLQTFVDASNGWDGAVALSNYQNYIGGDPVEVIYCNQPWAAFGCYFIILDVRPLQLHELYGAVGGLFYPSTAYVEAEWTLLPVAIT